MKIDQSIAHDGACLTVVNQEHNWHCVTAIDETLKKTNMLQWAVGQKVNLERCLQLNSRVDGHMVTGHVDCTAICTSIEDKDGSWIFTFDIDHSIEAIIIEKGSISVNGVSLTLVNVNKNQFEVHIIPYTFDHTGFSQLQIGQAVNIEFDMIGKYVKKFLSPKP